MKRVMTGLLFCLFACTDNVCAKTYGGTKNVEAPPCQKVENVTWKDDQIWYVTRPFRPGEAPETHTFREESKWGVVEGAVVVKESCDKK